MQTESFGAALASKPWQDEEAVSVDQEARQAAGEVILGGFPEPVASAEFAELLRSGRVGGAVLFRHNFTSCEQAADLAQSLKALRPGPG